VAFREPLRTQAQALMSQSSYLSSNDPRLHFGLRDSTNVNIEIRWPNGGHESFVSLAANQRVTIKEGAGIVQTETLG